MITVYGVYGSPFVRKVVVALEDKQIPYQLEPIIPMGVSPEYKKIHPLGKIPAIKDGDLTLPDSSAICAYLDKKQPSPLLYPTAIGDFGRALWFEEYSDTALAQVIGGKIFFPKVIAPKFMNKPCDEAAVQKAVDEDLPPLFNYLEEQLGSKKFLVGDQFSIADLGVGSQMVNLVYSGVKVSEAKWPKLAAYFSSAILQRPSFKKVMSEEEKAFKA